MSKMNLSGMFDNFGQLIKKHSPEILTGLGIAGMITTTVLAVKATPKALRLMEDQKHKEKTDVLTPIQTIQTVWPCYVPAAVTGALSIVCLTFANSVNARRNAALATAYGLSESALKVYQEKVVETIGEKKEQVVRDAIAKDQVDSNPLGEREIIITGKGEALCYDSITGRYFKTNIDRLRKAENEINRRLRNEMYISLNEFYDEIGLSHIPHGYGIGWDIEKGYLDLSFSSQLADDCSPCLVVNYQVYPEPTLY